MNRLADLKKLDYKFPEQIENLFSAIYYNDYAIFVLARIEACDQLTDQREQLENFIGGYFQNKTNFIKQHFNDLDIIWDIYLILIIDFPIDLKKRLEIENDRFICKKIVINYEPELSLKEHLSKITLFQPKPKLPQINQHLNETAFKKELIKFTPDQQLKNFIKQDNFLFLKPEEIDQVWQEWLKEGKECTD